ncbi:MAG TPA: hypothetical protein VFA83_17090 [Acidimicrobiales bacterium]|nr:hypothetical protein [Acidimicrobiales bacterium]
MITENEARRLMHEAVDGLEPSPGQLGAIRSGAARRTRQRRWVIGGVAVATTVALVIAAVALAGTTSPKKPALKVLGPPAVNGWTPIVASPGPAGSVQVWTGHEFIAAGDCCSTDVKHDLHAYNPATRSWRDLPPTPLSVRGAPVGVWTGKEVIIAGGYGHDASGGYGEMRDGAAVDPVSGRWHNIAAAPDGFSSQSARVVWTGNEMLVWRSAGSMAAVGDERVMAYDPRTDAWRELPASGLSARDLAAVVWTGNRLLVWGGEVGSNPPTRLGDGAMLDPETGTWTPVAPAPIKGRAAPATVIIPGGVFVWGGYGPNVEQLADGAIFDPASNSWRAVPAGPMAGTNNPLAVWTGREAFVVGQHVDLGTAVISLTAAVFNPATSAWQAVPAPPGDDVPTFHGLEYLGWTGIDVLLVQLSSPVHDGVSNVSDDQLDGFTWRPTSTGTVAAPASTTVVTAPPTTTPPTTTAAATRLYTCANTIEFEPSDYVLACADYNAGLQKLHWTSWTESSATATGEWNQNDCQPDCADGHFHQYPVRSAVFDKPTSTSRGVFFNRLTVTFAGAPPNGRPVEVYEPLLPTDMH